MTLPRITTREEWLAARKELLAKEKELTRLRDALNTERRNLPMVEITKDYVFQGPGGPARLIDLFEGRRQLIVYHFMFDPEWEEGCAGCSLFADSVGHLAHLHARDTSLVLVSRAPMAKLLPFRERMGWRIPWFSSFGSDFNHDFHATTDAAIAPVEYNYRDADTLLKRGESCHVSGEQPGLSVFVRHGERIFHSYSTFGRGMDPLLTPSIFLDLTPGGRQEGWGGMPDLNGLGLDWVRHHDRYDGASESCCGS